VRCFVQTRRRYLQFFLLEGKRNAQVLRLARRERCTCRRECDQPTTQDCRQLQDDAGHGHCTREEPGVDRRGVAAGCDGARRAHANVLISDANYLTGIGVRMEVTFAHVPAWCGRVPNEVM
jgi:hypothetical protein